jgi:glycosyltransferase involved in cell wall biosynthesis
MKYSIIIPVYNRPEEVGELLDSLIHQTISDFEVIVVEDGSTLSCEQVCNHYQGRLDLHYFRKENSGPGQSRNEGARQAKGTYLIILDSDVTLPPGYLQAVNEELYREPADAFGGPDRASASFTPLQKAISISMTSFFTTGGIRGGKKKLDKFYPRSFNMGVRREVYQNLGGFSHMRFGEDIDFSIRIYQNHYHCRLFPEAWVWHKRRTNFRKFWKQVFNSGIARINLYKKYPESLKIVHLLPAAFTTGVIGLLLLCLIGFLTKCPPLIWIPLLPLAAYYLLILADGWRASHSFRIGILAGIAAYVQLTGYGCGFLKAWWQRCICKKGEFAAYQNTFYK